MRAAPVRAHGPVPPIPNPGGDPGGRKAYEDRVLGKSQMFTPDFLESFDRLVAFDAETTGKRAPERRIHPPSSRSPGSRRALSSKSASSKFCARATDGRRARAGAALVNPDGPIDPAAIRIHQIRPGRSQGRAALCRDPGARAGISSARRRSSPMPTRTSAISSITNSPARKRLNGAKAPMTRRATSARKGCSPSFIPAPGSR